MKRIEGLKPRRKWKDRIYVDGLVFSETVHEDGHITDYWNENAAYQISYDEQKMLERISEDLHRKSKEAAAFLIEEQKSPDSPFKLPIPDFAVELATESFQRGDMELYGRLDLAYNEAVGVKMYEYNADTPTGLIESAVSQWNWLEETNYGTDQWNDIDNYLTKRWAEIRMKSSRPNELLYFAHTAEDDSGEDMMTTAYLRECAYKAGWGTHAITMEDIGVPIDKSYKFFTDLDDEPIRNIFKLFPWEDMVTNPFGEKIPEFSDMCWFEPAWKMFLSTKILPAAMWHIFTEPTQREHLLATYVGDPHGLDTYVRKPIHGREGDSVDIFSSGTLLSQSTVHTNRWGDEGYVYQDYFLLPNYTDSLGNNNYALIGSWLVGEDSVGMGVRESDTPVTDMYCRFVPHILG